MNTRQTSRAWTPFVAFCLLALLLIFPTPSITYGDEWVNYYEKPDIVYEVAVEADPVEQARNSFKYIVWFATEVGVFRFDNDKETYTRYTFADGLSHNAVKSILVDGTGNKWFGTTTGELNLFDNAAWTLYPTPDITPVNAIAMDADGTLWLARGDFVTTILGLGGVHVFDGTDWLVLNRSNFGLASNYVETLIIDSSGNIWMGTCPPPLFPWNLFQTGGLHRFDGTALTTYKKTNGLANNNVFDIAEDSAGQLWIATLFGGVSLFDGATSWTTYNPTNSGLASGNVLAVAIDSGHQWFGTNAGASVFDGTAWTTYDTATSGLVNNMVHDVKVYETKNGSREIWFGTGNGVSRYKPGSNKWKTVAFDGILNTTYNAVAVDGSNTKWFATDAGASAFDGTTWTLYNTASSGLVSDIVRSVAVDGADKWFATDAGASMFDGATWTTYTISDGLASDNLYAVAVDGSGNIWFGTDAGASMFDGAAWTTYTVDNGLASNTVSAIAVAGSNVWFGTDAGASMFDGSTWTTYTVDDGLASNTVNGITADGSGNIWFATDAGASVFDGSAWTTYDTGSGSLITNTVYCVTVDTADNIWLGTDAGASRFDGSAWTLFSVGSGIGGRYARAAAAAGNGDVWFTTDSGVSGYIKSVVVPPVTPPTIEDPPATTGPVLFPDTSGIGCFIQSLGR